MQKVIQINLSGYPATFQAHEEAYNLLARYLQQAQSRLKGDLDRDEVMRDLEQSIGEKLDARLQASGRMLDTADIQAVLAEIGPVDTGGEWLPAAEQTHGRRRLFRIQEGQQILGVCQGIATYADIRVDWVRSIFLVLATVTGGVFILVYFVMAFFLPIIPTRKEYLAYQQ
jgi:phage shock protein C